MTLYNKLVRDLIPHIIRQGGETPYTRVLNQEEYVHALSEKLQEEVLEFRESHDPEELADILEVVYALARTQKLRPSDLERLRQRKRHQRGGFEDRIFLVGKE